MGAEVDAILFWGWPSVTCDWDAIDDYEEIAARHGCVVIWYGDARALAIAASKIEQMLGGCSSVAELAVDPSWAASLDACRRELGATPTEHAAPDWQLVCHVD